MSDLHWMTVGAAARAIAAKELSPVDLTKALLGAGAGLALAVHKGRAWHKTPPGLASPAGVPRR